MHLPFKCKKKTVLPLTWSFLGEMFSYPRLLE
eukprot:UN22005